MTWDDILGAAFRAAFWGGLVLFFMLIMRRKRKQVLTPLAGLLDERSEAVNLRMGERSKKLEGHFRGRPVNLELVEVDDDTSKGGFQIAVSCGALQIFKIRPKLFRDKLSKAVGRQSVIETGNTELGKRFTFSCGDPDRLGRWAQTTEVREKVGYLMLSFGLTRLENKDGWLISTFSPYDDKVTDRATVVKVLEDSRTLAQSLESLSN